ncbi:MAG: hypothetical protein JRI52_04545, partial [Deltaproteobacteria bacterium]|nr:hypothetical protein [Deltaproteobacteria bacterium]
MRYYNYIITVALFFVLSSCTSSSEIIRDIRTLNQDIAFYIDKSSPDLELVTSDYHKMIDEEYNTRFFLPWHLDQIRHSRKQAAW